MVLSDFDQLRADGGLISAELINDATVAYNALYAQASLSLQAWMASWWSSASITQYTGVDANLAWQAINEQTVPTAISVQQGQTSVAIPRLILIALLTVGGMFATVVIVLKRSER